MAFPSSPTNGQTAIINNTQYSYNSSLNAWFAVQSGQLTTITLTSGLVVAGNITAQTANVYGANHIANTATFSAAYYYANGLAFQGGVSSISAGTGVSVSSGTGAVTVSIGQAVGTGSTPTFAGLTVSGAASVGNVITTNGVFYPNGLAFTTSSGGTTYSNTNVASYLPTYTGTFGTLSSITTSGAIVPSSNASVNLGSTSAYWNNVYAVNFLGTSTTAKYADLAEKYLPDAQYEVGTVMMVGGAAEITQHSGAKVRAIGVISEHPAYMMNSGLDGGVYVALKGRVPVRVIGPINKGQSLIGTAHGLAVAQTDDSQCMFAIALQDYNDRGIGLIEAVIL
jgi:hypothetical protein